VRLFDSQSQPNLAAKLKYLLHRGIIYLY
jgi:hypothetical protein